MKMTRMGKRRHVSRMMISLMRVMIPMFHCTRPRMPQLRSHEIVCLTHDKCQLHAKSVNAQRAAAQKRAREGN
jgi:hypothetical protein